SFEFFKLALATTLAIDSWRLVLLLATAVSLIGYPNPASAATFNVTVGVCHYPCGYFPFVFGPSSVTIHPGDQVMWTWASYGHPDWVLRNAGTSQTAIWYMNNNIFSSGAYGPTLAAGWGLSGAADFNSDGHPDYGLFNFTTRQTAIWYLSGPTQIGTANGPT